MVEEENNASPPCRTAVKADLCDIFTQMFGREALWQHLRMTAMNCLYHAGDKGSPAEEDLLEVIRLLWVMVRLEIARKQSEANCEASSDI